MYSPEASGRLGERHGHSLLGRQRRQRNHRRRCIACAELDASIPPRRPRRRDARRARAPRARPPRCRRVARHRHARRSARRPVDRHRPAPLAAAVAVRRDVGDTELHHRSSRPLIRWGQLGDWLNDWTRQRGCDITIDAGTGQPPPPLVERVDRSLLVTRPCYLALRRAVRGETRPTGVVLVDEPGRALSRRDVEHALGVPVEATVSFDPAVARAVDAGLLATRLPRVISKELRRAAA